MYVCKVIRRLVNNYKMVFLMNTQLTFQHLIVCDLMLQHDLEFFLA